MVRLYEGIFLREREKKEKNRKKKELKLKLFPWTYFHRFFFPPPRPTAPY